MLCVALVCLAVGCQSHKEVNPSFALTVEEARVALDEMRDDPKPLERPVLVLGGYLDPGVVAGGVATRIKKYTGDDRVAMASFVFEDTFEACRDRLLAELEEKFPGEDPDSTIAVDVVAVSMGGLVARYAALPAGVVDLQAVSAAGDGNDDLNGEGEQARPATPNVPPASRKRLRIVRLFTVSTPHLGAEMATLPTFVQTQMDMRAGSAFLWRLNDAFPAADYEVIPYVRLGDAIVGVANAAPPGMRAWWVPNRAMQGAHLAAAGDPRITADILRRLRGEKPFTTSPAAPLPGEADSR